MLRNINLHKKSQTITNTRVSPGERTLRYSVSGNPTYCRHNAIWHTASRKSEGKESCMECMILTGHSWKQRQANLFEFRPVCLQISARLAIVVIVSE